MTREQAIARLLEIAKEGSDADSQRHVNADRLLCEFLTALGYADVVAAYDDISPMWYE